MSKSEPTRGEWRVSRGSNYYVTTGDEDIGKACFLGHDRKEEALANARLMAASKDLLEALVNVTGLLQLVGSPTDSVQAGAINDARAAMSKALGADRVP